MNRFYWLLPFLLLLFGLGLSARSQSASPPAHSLKGKRVGLYLSLKNFQYSSDYDLILSGYIRHNDSLGLTGENLRRAVAIRAGNQLVQHLQEDIGAAEALYLNALPDIAERLVEAEERRQLNFDLFRELGLDYVLMWDQLDLDAEFHKSVRTYSNQLFTVDVRVDQAVMQWRVLDVASGKPLNQLTVNYESNNTPPELAVFLPAPQRETSPERLFRRAYNLTLALMELSWP